MINKRLREENEKTAVTVPVEIKPTATASGKRFKDLSASERREYFSSMRRKSQAANSTQKTTANRKKDAERKRISRQGTTVHFTSKK